MTTNAGRSADALPRPYVTHAPMLGRPGTWDPVRKNVTPGAWLTASVYIDRTRHSSSAIAPVCGSRVLISRPLWPHFWNGLIAGKTGHFLYPDVIVDSRVVPRTLSGRSSRWCFSRVGFGSNRSRCDGPPPCHR